MFQKIFSFLGSILFGYLVAFFVLFTPFAVNNAQAGSVAKGNINMLPTNSFEMNANPSLIWSVTHGATSIAGNVGANYRNTYVYTDTAPLVIAYYNPTSQQGMIALEWIHRFPDEGTYNKWVQTATKAGIYGNPAQGYLWYSVPVKNSNALPFQAAIYHLLTPQELFKIGPYAIPQAANTAYGKVFGNNFDYNRVAYCSANNTAGTACSDLAYKAGQSTFFQIVAEVSDLYHTFNGFVEVDNQTTYTTTHKSSGFFRSTVTIKVYQVTVPTYYMIVPATTPGITQMGLNGFLVQANASSGYTGFLKVQANAPGEWGWDFSSAQQLIYQKSESGWNTWVGIALGGLGMIVSLALPLGQIAGPAFFATSAGFAGLSAINLARGNTQFYNTHYYNIASAMAGANTVTQRFIQYAAAYWGAQPLGNQYGGGVRNTFQMWDTTAPLDYAGMTVGAYQASPNEKAILNERYGQ